MVLKTKEIAYVNYSAGSRNPVEAFKRKSGIACVYVCVCVCVLLCVRFKDNFRGLPWWCSGLNSSLPVQRPQVRSLVRELDPTCMPQVRRPRATTKEPGSHN